MFNVEQEKVINELDENILLLASAGTGKTNTLAYRVANILSKNRAKGNEILCISFTNKACNEMKERIAQKIGYKGNTVVVKTFHSFAFDIIKEYSRYNSDVFCDFVVFDEEDCREIVKSINYFSHPVENLHRFIDFIKEYRGKNNLENYEIAVEKAYENESEKIERLCKVRYEINMEMMEELKDRGAYIVSVYDNVLSSNHGLDFKDLIIKIKEIFSDNKILSQLRNRYKFINIDEVQDTSLEEYSIIEGLFAKNNILLCGDIFQTIYEWRGSNPNTIFTNYKEKYKPIEIIFNKNYRGSKILTEFSFQYLKDTFKDKVKDTYQMGIESQSDEEGNKIKVGEFGSIREEAKWIYEEIKKLKLRGSKDICILTRNNNYNIKLSEEFQRLNYIDKYDKMEFALIDQFKFFRRQEVKDIVAYLKLLLNSKDSISFIRILKRLQMGISDIQIKEITSNEVRKIGVKINDFLESKTYINGDYFYELIRGYEEQNIIVYDVESTGVDTEKDEIIQIAAIKIDKNGIAKSKFERFIKPKNSVGTSQLVHGFTDEYLSKYGENKEDVLQDFLGFTKGSIIVGHNVGFDVEILTNELRKSNMTAPEFKEVYDTLDIYRRFYLNVPNYKLETLSNVFDTNHKPDHNAMNDILATGELLVNALIEKIIPNIQYRINVTTRYLNAFTRIKEDIDRIKEGVCKRRGYELIGDVVNIGKLKSYYEKDIKRLNNMRNFYKIAREIDDSEMDAKESLIDLIKITALSNGEMESLFVKQERIPIITIHQAKGLEFDNVFLTGLNEGIFPSYVATKDKNIIEEERLFYVAITRAKKELYITSAGEKSRFLDKIEEVYLQKNEFY